MPESTNNDQEQAYILTNAGQPFKTETAARFAQTKKGLEESHTLVEVEDGWALAPIENNVVPTPKPVVKATKESLQKTPPAIDEKPVVLCPKCGHKSEEFELGDPCQNPKLKTPCSAYYGGDNTNFVETYKWVQFAAKSHANDYECVTLGCNGEVLQIQRGKPVCLPGRFVEVAENALKPNYEAIPGGGRKKLAPVMTFPFSLLREGTREEYLDQRDKGTEQLLAETQGEKVRV